MPLNNYGLQEFIAYTLYPILYIAGPIVTFNCYITQLANPISSNTRKSQFKQFGWTLFLMLLLEIILHYGCFHAVSVFFLWEEWENPLGVALVGFWTLQFMFFKFLCMWRFFRTFALFDNIVAPDNMTRCMHNSKTFTEFWRAWHASFNKWTIRYIYMPLGGKKTQAYSIWIIFFFIGLWHDLWWSWVAWALMNCLFFTIELFIINEFSKQRVCI